MAFSGYKTREKYTYIYNKKKIGRMTQRNTHIERENAVDISSATIQLLQIVTNLQ